MTHATPNCARLWSSLVGLGLLVGVTLLSWYGLPTPEDPEARAWAAPLLPGNGARVRVPDPKEKEGSWKMVPMSGGPSVYTACVGDDRLFAMNRTAWRGSAGLWPDVALTVSKGGCRGRVSGR